MKKIFEWITAKLNIRFVVRRAVEQYYEELLDIEYENKNDLCVYGEKYKNTYKYARLNFQANILKFKIAFWERFV